ncbi:family 43 glycosylhydrolase [Bacteroidota bacterium]
MIKRIIFFITICLFVIKTNAIDLTGGIFAHDPATIMKEGDTYWRFWTAPGIGFGYSKDLKSWTYSNNHIFTPGINWKTNYPEWTITYFGTSNTDGNLWAPDIIYMNGAYYLYYSCSSFGSGKSAIGVVKSTNLNNPTWEDLGMVVSSSSSTDINAIDPGMFRDDDGKVYMVYGSWHGGIGIVDIDTVTGLATSEITTLYGGNWLDTEAPALFKEDGYYYLVVNRGTCCDGVNSGYYILVGRSTNVKGPYTDFETLLPNKDGKYIGPGHFSLFRDSCANYVSIHYYDENNNGSATLDILKFKMEDGWPVLYRDFAFDNCNDELYLYAGTDEEICEDLPYELSSSSTKPSAMFYSELEWNDNGAGGSFNDATIIQPIYTPSAGFTGDITLELSAIGADTTQTANDDVKLTIITNSIVVDAGSDEMAAGNVALDLSEITTSPTAFEYDKLTWSDGEAGGTFTNKKILTPKYTPINGYSGPVILTLTASGIANCFKTDSLTLTVEEGVGINSFVHENIKMYPNPISENTFNIDIPELNDIDEFSVTIFSMDGKRLFNQNYNVVPTINIECNLLPGVYMVNLIFDDQLFIQKISVQY